MLWFVPRGLITAVLGIEVFEARGTDFAFLPSLACTVVLLSNLALLISTIRARSLPPWLEPHKAGRSEIGKQMGGEGRSPDGMRCTLPSYRRARSTDKKETGNEED